MDIHAPVSPSSPAQAPRAHYSIASRVWLLVVIGLAALAAAHGALWLETLRTTQAQVHVRLEAAALQYATALSLNSDGKIHVDPSRLSLPDFHAPGSTMGVLVLVNGRAIWASPSLRSGPFPDVPGTVHGAKVTADSSGTLSHPESFDLGIPGRSGNVHRLAWPVLLNAPTTPVGCPPSSSSTSSGAPASSDVSSPCSFPTVVATILVVERDPLGDARLSSARDAIFLAFCAAFIAIALAQIIALRLVLRPVRRLTSDLEDLVKGRAARLEDAGRPLELAPVVALFNQLLDHETASADLHRKALANLAHSFKTPLAIMSTILQDKMASDLSLAGPEEVSSSQTASQMQDQIHRLSDLVAHYLAAASAAGGSHFGASVPLETLASEMAEGLEKIHRKRGIYCEFDLGEGLTLPFAPSDANELLGNLLDNAFKWANHRVTLSASAVLSPETLPEPPPSFWPAWARSTIQFTGNHWPRLLRPGSGRPSRPLWLMLTVEDDGPGVSLDHRLDIFQRGVRTDERVPGHGVGLSIVEDLVRSRGGTITVDSSELGGARFVVLLPLIVMAAPFPSTKRPS